MEGGNKQNSPLRLYYLTGPAIVKGWFTRDNVPGLLRNKAHYFEGLSSGKITFNDLKIVSDVTDNDDGIHIYQT